MSSTTISLIVFACVFGRCAPPSRISGNDSRSSCAGSRENPKRNEGDGPLSRGKPLVPRPLKLDSNC